METFGKFMLVILIMTVTLIINGFVFLKLWLWFIVPTFQMQPLRIIEAIGISLLISFIRTGKNKEDKKNFWENILNQTIFNLGVFIYVLLTGWIITLFL
jgi:hypothetical protein